MLYYIISYIVIIILYIFSVLCAPQSLQGNLGQDIRCMKTQHLLPCSPEFYTAYLDPSRKNNFPTSMWKSPQKVQLFPPPLKGFFHVYSHADRVVLPPDLGMSDLAPHFSCAACAQRRHVRCLPADIPLSQSDFTSHEVEPRFNQVGATPEIWRPCTGHKSAPSICLPHWHGALSTKHTPLCWLKWNN